MELILLIVCIVIVCAIAYNVGHHVGFEKGLYTASDIAIDKERQDKEMEVKKIMHAVDDVIGIQTGTYFVLRRRIEDIL